MRKFLTLVVIMFSFLSVSAQKVGIKSNLISDVALSPNLGLEIGLAKHWTLDISGQINAWTVNKHKWKHWLAQPELRWWYCERFQGSFWGIHALGGQFNIGNIPNHVNFFGYDFSKLGDYRYQGWGAGGGISYGYAWILSKHWNLEAEIGVGYVYLMHDTYPACAKCGSKLAEKVHNNYFGPTKLALNIEYLF